MSSFGISGMPSIARLPRVTRSTSAAEACREIAARARTSRRVMWGPPEVSGRRLPQAADSEDRPTCENAAGGTMATHKVGYFVGSLAKASINRKLAKALVRLAPGSLTLTEIAIRDLPLYSYDYDADYPAPAR